MTGVRSFERDCNAIILQVISTHVFHLLGDVHLQVHHEVDLMII